MTFILLIAFCFVDTDSFCFSKNQLFCYVLLFGFEIAISSDGMKQIFNLLY